MDSTSIKTTNSKRGRKSSGKDPVAPKRPRSKKSSGAAAGAEVVKVKQEILTSPPAPSRVLVAMLEGRDCSVEMPILKDVSTVAFCDASSVSEIHTKVLQEARGIFLWDQLQLTSEELVKFNSLKVIVKMGPGVDNIDLEAAARLGIAVCHVNDNGIEEAADTTLGLILELYRKINWFDRMAKEGKLFRNFETIRTAGKSNCVRIRGDTLGLIGLGRVGVAVALRAKVFGFNVIFFDPYLEDGVEKSYGLTRVYTLTDLLNQSDCVSLHCGLNSENAGVINQYSINYMRPGAFLVNVSNSRLINEVALSVALRDGRIQGAALNTFGYDLINGPLREAPNITCIPNSAFMSETSLTQLRETAAEEMRRGILDGIPGTLRYLVNREFLSKAGMLSSAPSTSPSPPPPGIPPDFDGDYYAAAAYAAVVAASASMNDTGTA